MSDNVIVNDRTAQAAAEIGKLTNARIEEYLDKTIEMVKTPASPVRPFLRTKGSSTRRRDPADAGWTYDSGGVARLTGHLAASAEWKKEGKGYIAFTATGYGAYHELGTAHTPPNPAWARAFAKAREELLASGPWA